MPLTNRQLIRDEIATGLATISAYQAFYAYAPKKLSGISPAGSIVAGGSSAEFFGRDTNMLSHTFVVTNYVNRDAHGEDETENLLDQLYINVMQWIRDNNTGTHYMEVLPVAQVPTRPGFVTIDGIPYRFEEIRINAASNPTG